MRWPPWAAAVGERISDVTDCARAFLPWLRRWTRERMLEKKILPKRNCRRSAWRSKDSIASQRNAPLVGLALPHGMGVVPFQKPCRESESLGRWARRSSSGITALPTPSTDHVIGERVFPGAGFCMKNSEERIPKGEYSGDSSTLPIWFRVQSATTSWRSFQPPRGDDVVAY